MKFLVDESAGRAVLVALQELEYDVLGVADIMPHDADDDAILSRAVAENRIILTNDKDFGEMIYRSQKRHKGVVLFRLKDESAANRARVARMLLEKWSERLPNRFTVASERGVRIREK